MYAAPKDQMTTVMGYDAITPLGTFNKDCAQLSNSHYAAQGHTVADCRAHVCNQTAACKKAIRGLAAGWKTSVRANKPPKPPKPLNYNYLHYQAFADTLDTCPAASSAPTA